MEEKPQLSAQVISNIEEDGGGDEEFYEKIEAPKFVDFTTPDPYRPDDRYWFCLRVGCDQKHEEEMDPEAISKNFVLRVLAARSPNIRLRQALNRKASSVNEKCPLSAPAKPSKSRISRLAVISSFSQKMTDARGEVKPLSKLSSTPNPKVKQVAAKYLTTPSTKKCLPNPNSFRSVQNPKPTSIAVPKNRMVAKALVFPSPKKAISIKTSSELCTPLTKIFEGMKKLEIASQRKCVLDYSNKSSKDVRRDTDKSLPLNPSKRRLSAYKDKSKVKELFRPPNCKEKGNKSSRCIKMKSKGNSNKLCNYKPKETVENDLSGMEIDMKSRDGSELGSSRIIEGNVCEECLITKKTSGSSESIDSTREACLEVVSPTKNSDTVLSSNSEEGCLEENDFSKFQGNSEEGNKSSSGIDQEVKTKACSEKRESAKDHQTEPQNLRLIGHESEAMDSNEIENAYSDEKENALASDGNRDFDHNNNHSRRKMLRKQEANEITKKVAQTQDKYLKEGLTVAATGALGMKYKRPKPTNPKPFRLRTDERGILKEANLERRMQTLVPQKETVAFSTLPGKILHKRHENEIQRNEKCLEQSECNHNTHESSGKEIENSFQKDEPKQSRTAGLRTSEEQARPKIATKPVRSRLEYGRDVTSQKSENSLRKTKSPSLQEQFVRPKGVASTKKAMACSKQLTVIKEISSTASRSEEAGEPSHSDTSLANKATSSAASRSLSQGKRPLTIPKEPNFHSIHVPKSCARKVT